MHLLDTDTLTYLYAGHPRVERNLRELDDEEVAITVITRIEMLRGRFDFMLKAATGADLLRAQQLLARTEDLLDQMPVVSITEASAAEFDRLRNVKGLRKIGRADLLVASIALAHRATLVTRNLRHFDQVPRLRVVNWIN